LDSKEFRMFESVQPAFAPGRGAPAPQRRTVRTGAVAALAGLAFVFSSALSFAAAPPEGFADLVDKVKPAVVNIASTQKGPAAVAGRRGMQFQVPPELRGTPFEEFLRRFFNQQGPGGGDDDED